MIVLWKLTSGIIVKFSSTVTTTLHLPSEHDALKYALEIAGKNYRTAGIVSPSVHFCTGMPKRTVTAPPSLLEKARMVRRAFKTYKKYPTKTNYNIYSKYRN